MALADQDTLSQDPTFRGRVRIAMVQTAIAVQGEAQGGLTTTQWQKRAIHAARILQEPDTLLSRWTDAVVADETITSASADSVITTRCSGVFDDMAGVTGEDLV